MGSNLTSYGTAATNGLVNSTTNFTTGEGTQILDLGGFTYDATNITGGVNLSSNGSDPSWEINSYDTSYNAILGTMKALLFTFDNTSTGTIDVGADVILQGTGSGRANDLTGSTGTAGTPGTIDPTSTFYYTGNDGSGGTTYSTLTTGSRPSSYPIGGITVGDPTSTNVSYLKIVSPIYAAGNVQPNATATPGTNNVLDLNGENLALSGAANVTGNGTITNSSLTAASVSFVSGATGGLSPGGAGVVASLTVTSATLTLNLANAGSSQFDIASALSYDQVVAGVGVPAGVIYGGNLTLNLLSPVTAGTTVYQLFSFSSESGSFANESNLVADATGNTQGITSMTFSDATGLLTIGAVPEPGSEALLLAGVGLLLGAGIWRRRVGNLERRA